MTALNNIIKRAMSLMKAHVEYSQNLAVEFSHLIKDYEVLIESTADIVTEVQEVQEEVELEAICAVFEELMENEPIDVLRTLRPYGVKENAEEAAIEPVAVEQLYDGLITSNSVEKVCSFVSEKFGMRRSRRIKKRQLPVFPEGDTPFQCSISPYRHKKIHSEKKSIRTRIYSGKRPFECSICRKRFGQKSCLEVHTRIHTAVKLFECTFCTERFSRKFNLKLHIRVHEGKNMFECSICKKKFGQKCNLEAHTRVHTGERPFVCTICSKRFTQKSGLNYHTRIHTDKKPSE